MRSRTVWRRLSYCRLTPAKWLRELYEGGSRLGGQKLSLLFKPPLSHPVALADSRSLCERDPRYVRRTLHASLMHCDGASTRLAYASGARQTHRARPAANK